MSHPYATADGAAPCNASPVSGTPTQRPAEQTDSPPPHPPASAIPAQPTNEAHSSSSSSVDDSRNLPSEPEGEDENRSNCSKSDTVVSHSDDVSSSSSSSPSASPCSTPDLPSRAPSHLPSPGRCDDAGNGREGGTNAQAHHHRRDHHRHHGRLHAESSPLHSKGGPNGLLSAAAAEEGEGEGYMGRSEASGSHLAGRVQTSEMTRFTHVLAAGGRGGTLSPTATAQPIEEEQQQQQRWWGPSIEAAAAAPPHASATSPPHPYQYMFPTDLTPPSLSFSPSPVRNAAGEEDAVGGAGRPGEVGATTAAAAAVPNTSATSSISAAAASATSTTNNAPTQRPRSASATASPSLSTATPPPPSSAPLPPTHPRRSASARSCASNSPSGNGGLPSSVGAGTSAIRASQTLFARNSSGCSPVPFSGIDASPPPPRSASSANSTPTYKAALRRSSSFTAGMLPPAGSAMTDGEGHPYLIGAAAPPPPPPPSLSSTAGRVHEWTSSLASSVLSATSSARPSVPLPPSHVGPASNLMAAVWVDLPSSQPGSRCATPINASGSDAQQQHRRRRTTPRRGSEPPSPVTSTLAASIASSFEGALYASSSAAAAALASMRSHYTTVATQTDMMAGVVLEWPSTPEKQQRQQEVQAEEGQEAHTTSPALSVERRSTPEKMALEADDETPQEEQQQQRQQRRQHHPSQATPAMALPPTAASVSSTSAEVSPRSFRASMADPPSDDVAAADTNSASKSSASANVMCKSCGGGRSGAEASAFTAAAAATVMEPSHGYPHTYPANERFAAASTGPPRDVAQDTETAASPTAAVVSPITLELPTMTCAAQLPFVTVREGSTSIEKAEPVPAGAALPGSKAAANSNSPAVRVGPAPSSLPTGVPRVNLSRPTEGEHRSAGSNGAGGSEQPHITAAVAAGAAPNSSAAQADEVQQLRSELAHIRSQYYLVLDQLRRMQQTGNAVLPQLPTAAAEASTRKTDDVEDVSTVSRSPSASSSSASSSAASALSDSASDERAATAAPPQTTTASSSDGDAATALQHVREALERTRQRTNTEREKRGELR